VEVYKHSEILNLPNLVTMVKNRQKYRKFT